MTVEDRRSDYLSEERFRRLQEKVDELDHKVDALSIRIAYGIGILAFLSIFANIVGPVVVAYMLQQP